MNHLSLMLDVVVRELSNLSVINAVNLRLL